MPCRCEEPREEQAGGTGADDAYLGAHGAECDRGYAPAGNRDPSGQRKSRVRASSRPMPRAATSSTGTSRGRSRRCGGTTMPSAATTTGPLRRSTCTGTASDAAPGRHLLRRPGVPAAAHLGELAAQPARVDDGVPGLPGQRAQRLLDDLVRRGGEQHLAHAGRVQRQPAADLADDGHRLAAGDPLDVEGATARRGRRGARCRGSWCARRGGTARPPGAAPAAPARAGRGPRACGRSRSGRRSAGRARPTRPARRAAGAPWSAACPSARRSRTGTAGGWCRRRRRGWPRAREVTERPGVPLRPAMRLLLPPSGSASLGSVAGGRTVPA